MTKLPPDEDDDKRPFFMPLGDIGTILLAGVFLVGMLAMVFGPSPFDQLFKHKPPPRHDNGVVDVSIQHD